MIGEAWVHALCDDCWNKMEPGREPYRVRSEEGKEYGDAELCCFCQMPTTSGIYRRMSPDTPGLTCQEGSSTA